jgi:hypothetical protein
VSEGVQLAVGYYNSHPPDDNVLEARKCMARAVRSFHERAGILTEAVEAVLAQFVDPEALIVEVAHQPNIFPYSGYYKKLVLGKLLGYRLSEQLDVPVVVTFGFVDQDFANPKWFRRTELPDINSQDGVLVLKLPVSRRSKKVMHALPAPDDAQVGSWKTVLENWLTNNIRRFNKLVKTNHDVIGVEDGYILDKSRVNIIRGRMRRVYELIDDSHKRAETITEFNAYFTAQLANKYWNYPMLFYEYSKVQDCFGSEYRRFIDSSELLERYSVTAAETYHSVRSHDITLDFNVPPGDQVPFWYRCDCGGKIETAFDVKDEAHSFRYEACPECGKAAADNLFVPTELEITDQVSPRAAFRPLLIANTLRPSIFVSGLAAQGFHMISRGLAEELDIPLPPYIIWHGRDEYRSLAKLVAEMTKAELNRKPEADRTMKEQKILTNYDNTMATIPSIIDYLVNIGLSELAVAWEEQLAITNDLTEVPKLPSAFDN